MNRHLLATILASTVALTYGGPTLQAVDVAPAKPWYPMFGDTDTVRCSNDGREDAYMTASPDYYLFADAASCCEAHFQWADRECRTHSGGDPVPNVRIAPKHGGRSETPWYPIFGDTDTVRCSNDGREDTYMRASPEDYLFADAASCCGAHFQWANRECRTQSRGDHPGPAAVRIAPLSEALWYPIFGDPDTVRCSNDGREDAYMNASPEDYLFADAASCCRAHFQWADPECEENSRGGPAPDIRIALHPALAPFDQPEPCTARPDLCNDRGINVETRNNAFSDVENCTADVVVAALGNGILGGEKVSAIRTATTATIISTR